MAQVNTDHVHKALLCTYKTFPQTQQSLSVCTEGIDHEREGPAVRPEDIIALEADGFDEAITVRIAAEEQT
jgi:hypothetical protein